ncbi:cell wall-binding repeat-containing protein [Clostridium magnum]|uniref:N-acetylmuramoyl-L-alanine amidase LytC n=1 Tax=Clostridium magnum DSM 2767 TaxID=1121326 RepID=A0A162RP10_9CLOT|nr:cell wall-binding repeat-containing protein [Clostridium magnum]KZL90184.1 N-acetylmuramoyl-L-alanine amidase LytC precursor [Clostridium magnum DSM 2767]SHH63660.1 Putative cell wall binding repeat 2 [Clostridium magnum DSM 2767]
MIRRRTFLSSVLTALVLSTVLSTANVQAATVNRVDGGAGGRIGTANKVATDLFGTATNVVLVNGYGYADAVSATPLAKQLNAPILLTGGKILEPEVAATIQSLGASKVYIVGGSGVVSSTVENMLKEKYTVERITGTTDSTRMGTNAEVAKKVLSLSGQKTAVLVNGQDGYADALSVASIAAQKGYPVLFGSSKTVAPVVTDVVTQNGLSVLAVGGEGVLPQSVASIVGGTKITQAADSKNRFSTNLAVLKYFNNNGGLDFTNIYVAAGGAAPDQFADALVASAAAAKTGSPLVLSGTGADESQVLAAQDYILANASDTSKISIIGGTASVSDTIKTNLQVSDTLEIIGIE